MTIAQGSRPMETFTWVFLADTPNLQVLAPYSEKFSGVPSLFWSGWSLVRLQLREKGGSGPESGCTTNENGPNFVNK